MPDYHRGDKLTSPWLPVLHDLIGAAHAPTALLSDNVQYATLEVDMTKYQVELADGNHRVSISCDSEQEAQAALSWAQRTSNQLNQLRRSTPPELQTSNEERTPDVG